MSDETIIRTAEGDLVDRIYSDPVDLYQHRFRRNLLLVVVLVAVVVAVALLRYFLADRAITYSDIREHFKYGSIGSETGAACSRRWRRASAYSSSKRSPQSAPISCPAICFARPDL